MKKIIIFLLLSSPLMAQNTLKVEYEQTYFNNSSNAEKKPAILYVKSSESVYVLNPQIKGIIENEKKVDFIVKSFSLKEKKKSTKLHKLKKEKVYLDEFFQDDYHYYIKDTWIDFKWEITKETKKIGNYTCTKAISKNHRGRVWEAWFTTEISVGDGPWKLQGLPGLILFAQDNSGGFSFIAKKIEKNTKDDTNNLFKVETLPRKTPQESYQVSLEIVRKFNEKLAEAGFELKNTSVSPGIEVF
ncbi:MAG: GLPGLI family protein [Thermonemataceae bacterium]|nr:GLPGLI family protein [Thermonemataceae bacterium]